MRSNRQILDDLFRGNKIDLCRGPTFDQPPAPLPDGFDFDKVEGMMLGLAIGDALGVTTEGRLPHRRRETYGTIRDYVPNKYVDVPIGFPSDDSQMAFWTLEQMLADGGFVPENVADCFCRRRIFGIGAPFGNSSTTDRSGKPWHECGPKSAGNGALMRIAPVLIPHLKKPTTDLWVDTALAAMTTHNDAGSTAACVAFVTMLWQLLGMETPPEPQWWPATYVRVAKELEGETKYRPRSDNLADYEGPIWRFVEERVTEAYRDGTPPSWMPATVVLGGVSPGNVPSVIYILMRHGDDLEEAIVRAVNDTKDNDTIAAIVGAAVGALHGRKRIPERWIKNLSGRTTDRDDGRIFELLDLARRKWWSER